MIARAGRTGEVFSMLPPLRMFFERLIEDRMAPMASHHVEGEELTADRPAARPRSASYATVLGSAAAVWSVGWGVAVSTVTPSGAWNRCQWPCGTTISIPAVIVKD